MEVEKQVPPKNILIPLLQNNRKSPLSHCKEGHNHEYVTLAHSPISYVYLVTSREPGERKINEEDAEQVKELTVSSDE